MIKRIFYIIFLSCFLSNLNASDLGTTGIIDTPSARFLDDGDLKITFSSQKLANITNITYQVLPWLEGTFRYTVFNPSNPIRGILIPEDGINDRSYGIKVKLADEGKYLPQIAFGIQDIIGTGSLGAEYFVSSKKINNFDLSLGMGWGRLGERAMFANPFGRINESFYERNKELSGGVRGGEARSKTFFSGRNASLFGGLSYEIEKYNLKLNFEYNSDAYNREIELGTIKNADPFSYGIEWNPQDSLKFSLSRQQGNQWGFLVSSKFNTKETLKRKSVLPFYSATETGDRNKMPKNLNRDLWYDRLFYDLDKSGILLLKASVFESSNQVNIEIKNNQYELSADALNQTLILSELHIPRKYKNFNIIINEYGFQSLTLSYKRISNLDESISSRASRLTLLESRQITEPTYETKSLVPYFNFSADLGTKFQFFDPTKPIKSQLHLELKSNVQLWRNWNLYGAYAFNIKNNFDMMRGPNSRLPHVRTDINRYLTEGESGLQYLYLQRNLKLSKEIYSKFYAGILEHMYAGLGAEILYMPFKSRWAISATVNALRKRDYDLSFGLLDYEVITPFISFFYATPFHNIDLGVHAGKYLAKDRGFTIDLRRSFDNGFSVGVFASRTNVSPEMFGEGGYDKGLYFRIPFNSFMKSNSRTAISSNIKSITRDGGQKLDGFTGTLWYDLRNIRYDSFHNNIQRILP